MCRFARHPRLRPFIASAPLQGSNEVVFIPSLGLTTASTPAVIAMAYSAVFRTASQQSPLGPVHS